MKNLSVLDTTPGALYPKIVSIVNQEVFSLQVWKIFIAIICQESPDAIGKHEHCDWFFLGEDVAIRTVSMETATSRVLLVLESRQIQ